MRAIWPTLRRLTRLFALLLALLAVPAAAQGSETGSIALTFDDLPGISIVADQAYVTRFNHDLLRALRRNHVPSIGFVNAGKLDDLDRRKQIAILRAWLRAGMDLGNHTFSHESPSSIGTEAYIADIAKGEPVIRRLLAARGKKLVWFRHPYLETGSPMSERDKIEDWLAAHHYRIASVTLENSDWVFSEPYDDAVHRGDRPAAAHIRQSYLAYTERMIAWHKAASRALFGREIAFVMLLHSSRLNADCLSDLVGLLRAADLRPVSLETAMRDPAYATPDHYAGKDGINWLERWARTMGRSLPTAGYSDPPADIKADYDRVDPDDR